MKIIESAKRERKREKKTVVEKGMGKGNWFMS